MTPQIFGRSIAGLLHRTLDASSRRRDVQVGLAGQAPPEFIGPPAPENEMRVAVHQAGNDHAPCGRVPRSLFEFSRQIMRPPNPVDVPVGESYRSILDGMDIRLRALSPARRQPADIQQDARRAVLEIRQGCHRLLLCIAAAPRIG